MPQTKCITCGRFEGKSEWFKRTQSIQKCETCKKEEEEKARKEHDEALALKDKELAIEKEKAVLKDTELAIEKEKAVASKEKELIQKEKEVALQDNEISSAERKQEKDLAYKKWEIEVKRAENEEKRKLEHKLKLEEKEQSHAAKKEEIELQKKASLEIIESERKAKVEVATIKAETLKDFSNVEMERLKTVKEAEDRRFKLVQPLMKQVESGQADIDKVQSLLESLQKVLIPSTTFQSISASEPLASRMDKEFPEPDVYSADKNVNENIDDSHDSKQ